MGVRSRASLLALAALALLACGTVPSPTPGSILVIRDELSRRGVMILSAESGASACPGQPLNDNALHLSVTTEADPAPRDLYLYLFRAREFEATAAQMDDCVLEYESVQDQRPSHRIEAAPYRALGAAWSDYLQRAVDEALRAASGAP